VTAALALAAVLLAVALAATLAARAVRRELADDERRRLEAMDERAAAANLYDDHRLEVAPRTNPAHRRHE
jgi:hypothetical protein